VTPFRHALIVLGLTLIGLPLLGSRDLGAAPREKPPRIRLLFWHDSEVDRIAADGFKRGLAIAGLSGDVEEFHVRYEPGKPTAAEREKERARAEAAARAKLRGWRDSGSVDLVVALGTRAALFAAEEIKDIPVLFTAVTHPPASGLTPETRFGPTRRNLAGNSNWIGSGRVIEVFRRAVPGLARLGVVSSPDNPVSRAEIEEARRVLKRDGIPVTLVHREARTPEELSRACAALVGEIDALWIPIDDLCYRNIPLVRKALGKSNLPILSSARQAAANGALVSLVCDYELLGLSAADIARRVLVKGEKPGTIPIGRLHSLDLLVNLDAAGKRLPPELVAAADLIVRTGDRKESER